MKKSEVEEHKRVLAKEFKNKNLGPLTYFLGKIYS